MNDPAWKEIIDGSLHDLAQQALDKFDIRNFLIHTDNLRSLHLLSTVIDEALSCNQLESAFIDAFTSSRTNNYHNKETIDFILKHIDLEKLQSQGHGIPEGEEYCLYRGISGELVPEIINGYSWTGNIDLAHWFAMRYAGFGNPSIYTTTVKKNAILFYTSDRDEDEYVLNPRKIEAQFLMYADQGIAGKWEELKKKVRAIELEKYRSTKL